MTEASNRGSEPWLQDADVTLYHGDVLSVLPELEAESVDCVVTSPPYWGLRDYGTGAWEGGDAECDHDQRRRERDPDSKSATNAGSSRDGVAGREECRKCGATRIDQQLGLEPTPEQYVERMVEVFREVRRVLAPHGTVWLNLGDSYFAQGGGGESRMMELGRPSENAIHAARGKGQVSGRTRPTKAPSSSAELTAWAETVDRSQAGYQLLYREVCAERDALKRELDGIKASPPPKNLVGIPWRVAFALQADGWYLRSDIIWSKPNPMPESVTDRPTKAHEYVFLLSKQPRYFFDQEAVREAHSTEWIGRAPTAQLKANADRVDGGGRATTGSISGRNVRSVWEIEDESLSDEEVRRQRVGGSGARGAGDARAMSAEETGRTDGFTKPPRNAMNLAGRNIRSVWEIATQPYPEAHFATFPEELARRCIAAGCPEQVCRVCGKALERVVEVRKLSPSGIGTQHKNADHPRVGHTLGANGPTSETKTVGWTFCAHSTIAANLRPGIVLDPFMGSGTVAFVARKLGRHAVGIDLSAEYLELAARRLQQQSLFAEPYEPTPGVPRGLSPLTGGAYNPPGQSRPHSNARRIREQDAP